MMWSASRFLRPGCFCGEDCPPQAGSTPLWQSVEKPRSLSFRGEAASGRRGICSFSGFLQSGVVSQPLRTTIERLFQAPQRIVVRSFALW